MLYPNQLLIQWKEEEVHQQKQKLQHISRQSLEVEVHFQ
uniref:Uncharacterized protein n=1 Tax=Amphimedon queenslandica TaxID=400682 RepID=A0A1X7UN86_AMPQE